MNRAIKARMRSHGTLSFTGFGGMIYAKPGTLGSSGRTSQHHGERMAWAFTPKAHRSYGGKIEFNNGADEILRKYRMLRSQMFNS